MPGRKVLFLSVFKAEIEDCIEDIRELSDLYARRCACSDIGSYVNNENQVTLSREYIGLENIVRSIDALDVNQYDDLQALEASVKQLVQDEVREYSDPEAVSSIALRKLEKVVRYMEQQ